MQVICTLGQKNHGKTALVQALSQQNAALSPTLDLAFSRLDLEAGNFFSVVDVPSSDLDKLLAGLSGIDAFLLVVAADEGIMPQTRQHLAILRLMGINTGVIAITKTDLAENAEWVELVAAELGDLLADYGFGDLPILAVSAKTGAGMDDLRSALEALFAHLPAHQDLGQPILPIDRIFVFKGVGVVVTGTLLGGKLQVGETVQIQPLGITSRIRALQSHHHSLSTALMGTRVAVNLASVDRELLYQGCVLSYPDQLPATSLVDVIYHHLPASPALLHHSEVRFFAGPISTEARLWLVEKELLAGGDSQYAQLKFARPLALPNGAHFVILWQGQVVGGGKILARHPKHRWRKNRPEVLERFHALVDGDRAYLLAHDLSMTAHPQACADYDPHILAEAVQRFGLIIEGEHILHPQVLGRLRPRAYAILKAFHHQHPLLVGMDQKNFLRQLNAKDEHILPFLLADGAIQNPNNVFKLRDRGVQFTKNQHAQIQNLLEKFEADPANPPSFKEVVAQIGEPLLKTLLREGMLVYLPPDLLLLPQTYLDLLDYARQVLEGGGVLTLGAVRDHLQSSRRIAMPFLDYLEKKRITRRDEEGHHLHRANWDELQKPIF